MRIDWWTLALQTVNVVVLIWILGRFLFRPIADTLAARRAEAGKLLSDAEAAKTAAEAARRAAEAEVVRHRAGHDAIVAAARAEAETVKETLLAAARDEAARHLADAAAEIERRRTNDAARAGEAASRLAVAIAGRLMERLPPESRIAGFLPGLVAAIGSLPEATRAELAGGGVVRPSVPRALTEAERADFATALAGVLGVAVTVAETVDPAILAGIEIATDHAVIRNSLRADLRAIETELTRHDPS